MDQDSVKSTLSNLAFGNVMAAAARDYQKEVLAQEKAQSSSSVNQDIDLDELMDDPELEKLHADRIAALKKEAEKRQALKRQGHGEYREISGGDFLGEVTGSEKVICHFYHQEFYRCKIMDKHLKSLAPKHVDTKFLKLDAENAPFFVTKLGIKTLPCVILFRLVPPHLFSLLGTLLRTALFFSPVIYPCLGGSLPPKVGIRNGIASDRLVGFQDLGGKDYFSTKTLEGLLLKKGIIKENKAEEDDDDSYADRNRSVRSSINPDSDSD
ncbi:hypothetical protein RND71_019483 [Anisodus tanguticus]|uniref:Thioredoxin domain-containing protein n=1 Tax=Anisodus tanguticus TaxID=243964 RepID=A0AAE1S0Y4_9SOLA|nr:hypothetical protein RND71_019483 [Anisodus tanguticus]